MFPQMTELIEHFVNVHNGKTGKSKPVYKCDKCDKEFENIREMNNHKLKMHLK